MHEEREIDREIEREREKEREKDYSLTNTRTHAHIYINIDMCVCVCVCVCIYIYIYMRDGWKVLAQNYTSIMENMCYIVIFIIIQHHNDTISKTDAWRKMQEETTQEDFFNNILPLTLLQGFERVVQGLHVRWCWRPNINFIFWPPLLMTVTLCLSCSLDVQPEA